MSSSESITVSHVPPHKSRGCDSVIPPTLDTDDSSEPPDECWTSEESQDEYSPTKSDICSDDSASEVDATMGNSDDDLKGPTSHMSHVDLKHEWFPVSLTNLARSLSF